MQPGGRGFESRPLHPYMDASTLHHATRVGPWRDVLGLLVAVATSVTLLYLLPVGLVFRLFQTWQSVALLVVFVIVAAAPGVYAVRTRTL